MHGASASIPKCHNVASVAAVSITMDAANNAAGLAGAAHAVSAAVLTAGSNSSDSDNSDILKTVPVEQFYWICRACSYTYEEDISRAVFGDTDEGTHVCVICYTTSPSL
jgi:rubrerythrin